jgi:hypothetical protein
MCRRTIAVLTLLTCLPAARAAESQWVRPGPDGRLVYKATERGDRIMDFSYAGYRGGGVALPDVPVRRTVHPTGTADDSAAIQAAIDAVSSHPADDHGFRGAVLLSPGTFNCPESLTIAADGVTLRGSGTEPGGTTLQLTGKPHTAITVGSRRSSKDDASSTRTTIADAYVPSGSSSFRVADPAGLSVGDWVAIRRPVTAAWVHFMHMDDLVRDGKPQTWMKVGGATVTERRIAKLDGSVVTLDVPLSDSFDARYLNPPGTAVTRIPPSSEVSEVGIEQLRITCPPQAINHTQAHFSAIRMSGQDCWVRDVAAEEKMNSVGVTGRRITLQRVSVTRKALHQGSSKPAEFAPNATQLLLDRCSVTADNVWFVASGAGVPGPVVILNCDFHGNGRAESHQRWSTGILYDNCRAPDGGIELRNRGSMGSGHGWSMGWGVVWNCAAGHYIIQNPPGTMNWLIGSAGHNEPAPRPFGMGPNLPEGTVDSPGRPVSPRSLYLAQLRERLGPQALKNIGYTSPDALPDPESH